MAENPRIEELRRRVQLDPASIAFAALAEEFGVSRTPVREDLWIAARRAADAGDYAGACHLLYAAVLDRMAKVDGLRLHPSKTSGDYWRELRRRGSPAGDDFRLFARRFDRAVYGTGVPRSEDVEELLTLADRMVSEHRAA